MRTPSDLALQEVSLESVSTTLRSEHGPSSPVSPRDASSLSDSISSLNSKIAISPPQTILESEPLDQSIDQLASPYASPPNNIFADPPSRNSSTRAMRISNTRPTQTKRSSRRSNSAKTSVSPAHAFLSSWGNRDEVPSEPVPEPKPDDEGQAIGLNNEYIIGRTINQGGFGVVKEAHTITNTGENLIRAVKIVRKTIPGADENENEKAQQELEHEVSVWRHLKHRHILDLHAVYDTEFATFCVMELNVGGTLFDMVRQARSSAADSHGGKGLETHLAKSYAHQLACALRYLHEDIRVCHRDVKLENCLVDKSGPRAQIEGGILRLCDFGLADFLSSDRSIDAASSTEILNGLLAPARPPAVQHPTTSSVIGTLEYASPKGLTVNRKLFETAGDVWAFGVIVYALCTGELPFRHPMPSKTVESIVRAEWDEAVLVGAEAGGSDARDLVVGCFEMDIDARYTVGDALGCDWFEGWQEIREENFRASGMWE